MCEKGNRREEYVKEDKEISFHKGTHIFAIIKVLNFNQNMKQRNKSF